jgi:predicted Zn-dependent protease
MDIADVLGRAVPGISRAWVFANRVSEMTKLGAIDANRLLARVVAHEIGHLLLESKAHAPHGICVPGWS